MQEGRDTPESSLPAQCGSLGTLMTFKPVLNPLLGPSLLDCLLLVSTSTIFFSLHSNVNITHEISTLEHLMYVSPSYMLRCSWVWPVLGCPQNSTSYCRKCWGFVCLSLPRTGALCCEDSPYQLWIFGSHLEMFLLGHVFITIQDALVPAGKTGNGTWVPSQPEFIFAYCSAFPYPLENIKANRLQRQAWRVTEIWEISQRGLVLTQGSTARATVSPLLPGSIQKCPWSIHVPTAGGWVGIYIAWTRCITALFWFIAWSWSQAFQKVNLFSFNLM